MTTPTRPCIAAIPAVIAYAVLTGMRVPTQRALIMALTYLIAIAFDRRREVWNALALAAAAVLIAWPEAKCCSGIRRGLRQQGRSICSCSCPTMGG